MRKIPKTHGIPGKSQAADAKPVEITVNPAKDAQNIAMPELKYVIRTEVDVRTKFTGRVTPIPTVLLHCLTHLELKAVAIIMEETCLHGKCTLKVKELAERLSCTFPTASSTLGALRKRGLLIETADKKGRSRNVRTLNFEAVQRMNDLEYGTPEDSKNVTNIY